MFNLDNLDLDSDDDFSSNIFSKSVHNEIKNAVDINEITKEFKFSNASTSKSQENDSHVKNFGELKGLKVTSSRNHLLDFPLISESKQNTLKRICVESDKPQKKRLSHGGLLKRKFPGPAGLLPDEPFGEISDLSVLMEKPRKYNKDEEDRENPMMYSQSSGSLFLSSNYQKLMSDFHLNESNNPLNRYTVGWVKKTALSKGVQGRKIPFLGLIVYSVNQGMPDPVLVLRDPTGEIHGSLHREVWADMGGKLRVGVALALRQVGVLITGVIRRQIYLNITMNNILSLYSSSETENQVEITIINKVSQLELLKSFEEWLAQSSKNVLTKSPLNSPLFTMANDINLHSKNKEEIKNARNKLENLTDSKSVKVKVNEKSTDEILANFGVLLNDGDFNEEMSFPRIDSVAATENSEESDMISIPANTSNRVLSRSESIIFEEVLNGINLDEFEM